MLRPKFLDIPPLHAAHGTVHLPGSKSISNRALLLAALCDGSTRLTGVLESDDTRVMLEALEALGCAVGRLPDGSLSVQGLAGQLPATVAASVEEPLTLFLGNAGTAMRPLAAVLALLGGHFRLTGVPRMYERPIGDLVDALTQLGARISYEQEQGYPPLRLAPRAQEAYSGDGYIQVRGDVSSQFLTALLMAAPLAGHAVTIEVQGELISQPYIAITLEMMWQFGVEVQHAGWQRFTIAAGEQYRSPGTFHVEADASSASYFIALGAIAAHGSEDGEHRSITLEGLGADSIQGDIRFLEAARQMGACVDSGAQRIRISRGTWPLRAIDMDCNHMPDAAMTLAVMALYADGPCTLRNIASWRVKETDRIAAMARELRRLGAVVEETADSICITPPAMQDWQRTSLHTYDDHRMAMCLSLAAFNPARQPVRIEDPACTAKTFPAYFDTFFSVVDTAHTADVPVICIDGPSASGKGTLAAELARMLGYHLLDSGALYRVTGLVARRLGWLDDAASLPEHAHELAALATALPLRFDGDAIWLGTENISQTIRSEQAGADASRVSALPAVRQALVALQHNLRQLPGLVADGRDMGTVIFPDATLKIFLTASAEQRAQRRCQQLQERGIAAKMEDILADLQERDARDTQRSVAPLQAAPDALLLDNSSLDVPASLAQVLHWWQQRQAFDRA